MRFSGCRSDIELYYRNKSSLVRPRSSALSPRPLLFVLSRDKRVITRHKLAIINYSDRYVALICFPYRYLVSFPLQKNNQRNSKADDFALTNCFFDKNVRRADFVFIVHETMHYIEEKC